MDKVQGGTPKSVRSICRTCRWSQVTQGTNFEEAIICRVTNPNMLVKFCVEKCSNHSDSTTPDLQTMKDIAWIVTSRNRGPVGFAGEHTDLIVTIEKPDHRFGGIGPIQQPGS